MWGFGYTSNLNKIIQVTLVCKSSKCQMTRLAIARDCHEP